MIVAAILLGTWPNMFKRNKGRAPIEYQLSSVPFLFPLSPCFHFFYFLFFAFLLLLSGCLSGLGAMQCVCERERDRERDLVMFVFIMESEREGWDGMGWRWEGEARR